jgi:hypothetical protein
MQDEDRDGDGDGDAEGEGEGEFRKQRLPVSLPHQFFTSCNKQKIKYFWQKPSEEQFNKN